MVGDLSAALAQHGLRALGNCPDDEKTIVLIGPDEPRFWDIFCDSPEYRDGAADPLDHWSRRVIGDVAARFAGEAVYPFDGPPFAPFFTWAVRSGRFWPSPIGFLVHDTVGLFASFRGAIRLSRSSDQTCVQQPCLTCVGQPCATACPVDAFRNGYDVAICKAHVASDAGRACRDGGCLARRACPVGQGKRPAAQSAFHMAAFL